MGRSWHRRNRERVDGPATTRFLDILDEHLSRKTEDELVTMGRVTKRLMRRFRKKRGADLAWLRGALGEARPNLPREAKP